MHCNTIKHSRRRKHSRTRRSSRLRNAFSEQERIVTLRQHSRTRRSVWHISLWRFTPHRIWFHPIVFISSLSLLEKKRKFSPLVGPPVIVTANVLKQKERQSGCKSVGPQCVSNPTRLSLIPQPPKPATQYTSNTLTLTLHWDGIILIILHSRILQDLSSKSLWWWTSMLWRCGQTVTNWSTQLGYLWGCVTLDRDERAGSVTITQSIWCSKWFADAQTTPKASSLWKIKY